MSYRISASSLALLLAVGLIACGDDDDASDICSDRELVPHVSPVVFGELSESLIPHEWHLLLHNSCNAEVTIEEACLIGDDADQFVLEGPESDVAVRNQDSVLRLTYERESTHSGDDQDDLAIVVQSDAENAPTIVVPVCARVVSDPDEEAEMECNSPVEIPAEGERVDGLCS